MNDGKVIDDTLLLDYFIEHLNRIYCAKLHVANKLPGVASSADFVDLKHAILETCDDVEQQISRMDKIYTLLNAKYSTSSCIGITALFEETFNAMGSNGDNKILRDLNILFYIQHMESIEISSFKIMQIAAQKLNNPEIVQLLKENFNDAKDDYALLLLINSNLLEN